MLMVCMLTLLCSKVGLNHGVNKCTHIQLPEKVSHLEENSNKKQGNEKLLLATEFEFVYDITAVYFSNPYFNEENPCAQNHGK